MLELRVSNTINTLEERKATTSMPHGRLNQELELRKFST
jgi:hypothetical protein